MIRDKFIETTKTGTYFIKVGATWCQPCKMIDSLLPKVEEELKDKATIIKIDVDESPEVAAYLNVNSVPTIVVFKDGVETNRLMGVKPVSELVALV